MPCYFPLDGWRARHVNSSGKRSIVFKKSEGYADLPVVVACGQCVGCRLECSRQWAMRCMHEAQLHLSNSFITLTYRDEDLPFKHLLCYDVKTKKPIFGGSLRKKDFQDFMKRLRERVPGRFSYFHCGEYGERFRRPHYHALLFGLDFEDKVRYPKDASDGSPLWTSAFLDDVWQHGSCIIGAVTFESAAYCARYVMKKVTGKRAARHYESMDLTTGEIIPVDCEYITMSLKPAIAKEWYAKFSSDVYPSDTVVSRGVPMRPPKYYDRLHESIDEAAHRAIVAMRVRKAVPYKAEQSRERLAVRHEVVLSKVRLLKREL